MDWYSFKPTDTLYFRGAEPLEKGISHHASVLFPPSISTISGAIRTACLKNNNISIEDYYKNKISKELLQIIGRAGSPPPFTVLGPVLLKNNKYYIPAPYSWFYNKVDEDNKKDENENSIHIKQINYPELVESPLIKIPGKLWWIKSDKNELISAGGKWIALEALQNNHTGFELLYPSAFYTNEERTGIALEKRTVKDGHLYSMSHIRLNSNVKIIFAVDKKGLLSDEGILKLGGEQRFGLYKKIDSMLDMGGEGRKYMTLAPVSTVKNKPIATGKISYKGGWDMKKGFHKKMVGYYPAGSVFNNKINDNCIAIREGK